MRRGLFDQLVFAATIGAWILALVSGCRVDRVAAPPPVRVWRDSAVVVP